MQAKREFVVSEIQRIYESGRSVLVGTPSVEASEDLGELLKQKGIRFIDVPATSVNGPTTPNFDMVVIDYIYITH